MARLRETTRYAVFVAKALQGLNRHGEDLHRLLRHAPEQRIALLPQGAARSSRHDDLLAVVERSGQLTNWAGVDICVAGTVRTVWNTDARDVEALRRAFFEKGGAKVRFYGPGLMGM